MTVMHRCHRLMFLWMSFQRQMVLKKVTSKSKLSNLVFALVFKREDDWISFSVLPTRSFHIAGPLMEIRNLQLCKFHFWFSVIAPWKGCWIRIRELLKFFQKWWQRNSVFDFMHENCSIKLSLYVISTSQNLKRSLKW